MIPESSTVQGGRVRDGEGRFRALVMRTCVGGMLGGSEVQVFVYHASILVAPRT